MEPGVSLVSCSDTFSCDVPFRGSLQQLLDTHLVPPEPVKIEYSFSPRTAVREIHDVEVEMVREREREFIVPLLPPYPSSLLPPVSHERHSLGARLPIVVYYLPDYVSPSLSLAIASFRAFCAALGHRCPLFVFLHRSPSPTRVFGCFAAPVSRHILDIASAPATSADNCAFACATTRLVSLMGGGVKTADDYVEEGQYDIGQEELSKLNELDDKVGPPAPAAPLPAPPSPRARPLPRASATAEGSRRCVYRPGVFLCVFSPSLTHRPLSQLGVCGFLD